MAHKKGVRLVLLVEDEALERFARQVAMRLGFHRTEMHVEPYPVGRGSAKQWVEQQYPGQVRLHRAKAQYQQVALLVGTEADEQSVQHRFHRLAAALQGSHLDPRTADERIAMWIPKWNVETWVMHLLGEQVDEETNYRGRVEPSKFRPAAEAFVRHYRGDDKQSVSLPSLRIALEETRRLE